MLHYLVVMTGYSVTNDTDIRNIHLPWLNLTSAPLLGLNLSILFSKENADGFSSEGRSGWRGKMSHYK